MDEDKTILYDILEPHEWPVYTEIIVCYQTNVCSFTVL